MASKKRDVRASVGSGRQRIKGRARIVLDIVATDKTFVIEHLNTGPGIGEGGRAEYGPPAIWFGKCIHCNRGINVSLSGETYATIEHIVPRCAGGSTSDPKNLALACAACNNEKGIRHDQHAGKGGRADEIIDALRTKRLARWREPLYVPTNYHW